MSKPEGISLGLRPSCSVAYHYVWLTEPTLLFSWDLLETLGITCFCSEAHLSTDGSCISI